MNYQYPVQLIDNEEGGYILSFRDIPNMNTEIWDLKELNKTAIDFLITALDLYFEHKKIFPKPSKAEDGEVLVSLPISVVAKMLLLNTMVSSNIRISDLARKMNIKPQEASRIVDLQHNTKIDTIQNALQSLGKELQLNIM
mgnify:CR=1 FL=1